jgi:hypothetical protein
VANEGSDVTEEELYQFLKHFHLLNYDLAKEKGIVLSLLQSHISQFKTLLEQNLARFTFVIKSATSDAWRACSNRPLTPSVSVVLIGPVIKAITYFTIQ